MRKSLNWAAGFAFLLTQPAIADDAFVVQPGSVSDQKAVFATVESRRSVPARARIGGTIAELAIKEGDEVELGQVLGTVADEKLTLQLKSLDAQIAGLEAQRAQAQTDLTRIEDLVARGTLPRTRLEETRTAFNVADNTLRARIAERSVLQQQMAEGNVLAPTAGRVLKVPLTTGAVVMPGESLALIAERDFVLRLRVPERHARFLKAGDSIRIDAAELGESGPRFGKIRLVYPLIEDGRVVADAEVPGLGRYFVSERIRVWVSAGERNAMVIPAKFIKTRFGVDYVKVAGSAAPTEVPVQRGRDLPLANMLDGVEILSGLRPGDRLVLP